MVMVILSYVVTIVYFGLIILSLIDIALIKHRAKILRKKLLTSD